MTVQLIGVLGAPVQCVWLAPFCFPVMRLKMLPFWVWKAKENYPALRSERQLAVGATAAIQ